MVSALALKQGNIVFSENIGGCNFTSRKIDRHIELIRALGIEIKKEESDCVAFKTHDVHDIIFDCATNFGIPSVGVTTHALIAAMVFQGKMHLVNVAQEPAIESLVNYVRMATGKRISCGDNSITVESTRTTGIFLPCKLQVPCDLTIAFTFVALAMATKSTIMLIGPQFSKSLRELLHKSNVKITVMRKGVLVVANEAIHPQLIECRPWPGIPTDIGPVFSAGLLGISGRTKIIDYVYNGRSSHIDSLKVIGRRRMKIKKNLKDFVYSVVCQKKRVKII